MVSETKLDNSFPVSQFLIDGYTPPFRLDLDNNARGIMVFVKLLSVENHPMKGFYVEINLPKTKPNGCFVAFTTQIDAKLTFT